MAAKDKKTDTFKI